VINKARRRRHSGSRRSLETGNLEIPGLVLTPEMTTTTKLDAASESLAIPIRRPDMICGHRPTWSEK